MRITLTQPNANRHTESCTSVATSLGGEILSGGDDSKVWRWNLNCEPMAKMCDLDSCVTVVKWMPGSGRKKGETAKDGFVVACADGTFRFVSAQTQRVDKVVEAHTGAITALAWNPDGSTMVTAGEDGQIKVWSQAGIQRTVLTSVGRCIYCLVWGADNSDFGGECVLYSYGTDLVVKPLNPSIKKLLQWKAHTGVVLCVDWSRMSNLIVTGGEDGTYKVWDPYGRNLFSSAAAEYPITSVSFAPDGEMFAVGSFMSLRVCDKTGWSHCRESTQSASVMALCWTPDGTQIVAGCGDGAMCVAQLVDRKLHWRNFTCTLSESKKLHIQDVTSQDTVEELEHRDKIIKLSMGYGFLVVATATQCVVYDVQRWNSPVQFDLRDAVVNIRQTEKTFSIADCTQGIQIYTYEGRLLCTIKGTVTLRPESLTANLVSLSLDTFAMRDPADAKKVQFFDASSGKLLKDVVAAHHMEITDCALSQYGALNERKLAFIDRNKDLYLCGVHSKQPSQKIATMVSSMMWNDITETLVALSDGRLVTWYYPSVVFVDRELLAKTRSAKEDAGEEFGRNDQITDFFGTRVGVRRGQDGALLTFSVSPYPNLLFGHVGKNDWDGATRLCRFIRDDCLWGILAALSVKAGELNTAEVAYAALNEVDKLRYISSVREIPSAEGRQAELALFQRRLDEAERILLQAGLVYRAIEMHTRLYNWERALEIAVERRTHVDTVVAYRQRHLDSISRKETIDKFKQVSASTKVDWDTINEKVKQELGKEKSRSGK